MADATTPLASALAQARFWTLDRVADALTDVTEPAVRRKAQTGEGLGDGDARRYFLALQVDDHHFVFAIAGVEHREPTTAGMQGEVDREITDDQLLAGRS